MTTTNLQRFLDPISGDAPGGGDLEYETIFQEMERAAEGKPERQVGDLVTPAEDPDWSQLQVKAEQVLTVSRDLRAAVFYTKARVHLGGYTGLSDGLTLVRGFMEHYWDDMHPRLDPEDNKDPTERINILINLSDPIEFLNVINRIPLVSSTVLGEFSLRDIQIAEGLLEPSKEDNRDFNLDHIDGAFRECPLEETQALLAEIRTASECVSTIEMQLNQRVGVDQAPSLRQLSDVLEQAEKAIIRRVGEALDAEENQVSELAPAQQASQDGRSGASGEIRNREDVIRTLDRLCQYYVRNEPSSPVPLLLTRAKRLVKKDFFDIVQDLAPDGSSHFEFLWKQNEKG